MKTENIKKKSTFMGLYSVLCLLVFATVGLLAFYNNTGNVVYLVASMWTLLGFLCLAVKVHIMHRMAVYDLEDLR